MAFFAFIATFTTFAALILEIFSIIGNLYDKPFLRDLYFLRLNYGENFIDYGLWNYCTGSNGVIQMCSTPVSAFIWTRAEATSAFINGFTGDDKLFMATFVAYWIAFGLTFLALIITLLSHFRRSSDVVATISCILAFIVLLAVFIVLLVTGLRMIHEVKNASNDVGGGNLGPAMWTTLGAVAGVLFSSLWYCISCICGSGRRVRDADKA
ncbi:unnamed protein product [Cunninghamella blakesleeana]